nr:small acid-soluble spore protein SspI [Ammoniphilus resinae]
MRQAVLDNVADSSTTDLKSTVVDAVQSGEDKILPGLGVLFEVLWKNSDIQGQEQMIQSIYQGMHSTRG